MDHTKVFYKNLDAFHSKIRRIENRGGTSSSKTKSILQLLLIIAQRRKLKGGTISIVSESMPHLKKGAMKDFETILMDDDLYDERQINHSDHQYFFGKYIVEFFSVDSIGKATGPRRNILYVNECNNIPYSIIRELEQRTSECIFYDYNPVKPFWIEDEIHTLPTGEFIVIKSNYLDNDYLPDAIKRDIELRASRDPNYKRIHIDCEYGVYEGLIFPEIIRVDDMPEGKKEYGLDYGFTNDPTVLSSNLIIGDNLYIDELFYLTGMTTPDIINALKSHGIKREEITGDSADPRMNEELRRAGFNVFPAIKGPGSIQHGIDAMKRYKIHVTKRSVNGIKEFRNYSFKIDSSGKATNEPIDYFNHFVDSVRYPVARKASQPKQRAPVYKTYKH